MARKMKDSGIEWIGEIPENWEVSLLKHVIQWKSEKGYPDETVLSLYRDYGVLPKDSRDDNHNVTSLDTSSYKLVDIGDLVINKMKAWQGSLAISKYRGIVSPAYHVCTITDESINRDYLHYLLRNQSYLPEYARLSTGMRIGQWDLGFDDFKRIPFLIPPLSDQHRIASYLDTQCAKIDAVLEQTRNSIEEYKKLKQAVITQAVTKGIRPGRKMKDSGIEWVKELPAEWNVIPSKYLFRNSDTKRKVGDEQMTASQQYGIITQKRYMELTGAKVVFANKGLEDWKHVEPFDFIISLRSFQGGLEMSENTGCITWHYIVLKPSKPVYSYYYKWLFKSELYIKALQRTCNYIRDGQDLRYSNFVQVPLFEPGINEQKEIAEYLNIKCAEIDELISRKQRFLTELESYKKSLIYECVTGKRKI